MQIGTLGTLGLVTLEYPPSLRLWVNEAMRSWRSFCALPAEEKEKFSHGDRLRDIGYKLRKDDGPRADSKEFFHSSLNTFGTLLETALQSKDVRVAEFVNAVSALLHHSDPLIREFAAAVEQKWNLHGFEAEVMQSQRNWTFRYLHYLPGSNTTLAHAHTDRGGFTLHLHESHPGGEYLGFDSKWRPFPLNENETVIFPSMGLQYRSKGALKALCHRVRAIPETAKEGRYSMVAFIDFAMDRRFNDARFRLQDFEPGFNYSMPTAEFESLFVPR